MFNKDFDELGVCDDVMEFAWSTMWNVTDETPINCKRFLDGGGMQLFLSCKEVISSIFLHGPSFIHSKCLLIHYFQDTYFRVTL